MKYLIAIATTLGLAAMVLLAIAIHNTSPVKDAMTAPWNSTPSTLTVTPNYGVQKTVSGDYLQPANSDLQPADANLQPATVNLQPANSCLQNCAE